MPDMKLSLTFDSAADFYEKIRPGYPDALIRDVISLSGIPDSGKILEIGCGTGQATKAFASKGYDIVCVDIGPRLLAATRRQLESWKNVSFEQSAFENWKSEQSFDLIVAATSFHWIDPEIRYFKSADLLRRGGSLAVFINMHVRRNEGFFHDVQDIYRKHVPQFCRTPESTDESIPENSYPGIDRFTEAIRRIYPWSRSYSAQEYVMLLGTYSGHIALPEAQRERLFDGIINMIETKYDGSVLKYYEAVLRLYVKR